jgi:hypothetical protein
MLIRVASEAATKTEELCYLKCLTAFCNVMVFFLWWVISPPSQPQSWRTISCSVCDCSICMQLSSTSKSCCLHLQPDGMQCCDDKGPTSHEAIFILSVCIYKFAFTLTTEKNLIPSMLYFQTYFLLHIFCHTINATVFYNIRWEYKCFC